MNESQFLPLQQTASRVGVPVKWLRSEAKAGRIPFVQAGRRMLFKASQVTDELERRARGTATLSEDSHA